MAFTDWVADEQLEEEIVEETVETTEVEEAEVPTDEEIVEEVVEDTAPSTPQTYNVNGQDLTIEELQTGYMRQQDYIAQREELNALREQNKQALELVEYLRKNPNLANKLLEEDNVDNNAVNVLNPLTERIEKLERERYVERMNNQIEMLKMKYKDFNEVDVLNKAVQLNTPDLEFVYHGMRGAKIDDIIAQQVKEQLAKAQEDMVKNTQATRTVVGKASDVEPTTTHNLTQQEMRVADLMGISYEEYAKYK